MPRSRANDVSTEEALLDDGVEMTFPASDPVAVQHAFESARRKRTRGRQTNSVAKPSAAGADTERARKSPRR